MATYYIDPTVIAGGAGTVSDPFNNFGEVSFPAAQFDFIKFKRGTTHSYADHINVWGATDVTIEAYYNSDGTDDITQPKPIIIRTTDGNTVSVLDTVTRAGQVLRNLDIRNATGASSRNLNIATTNYAFNSRIIIEKCDLYDAGLENLRVMGSYVTVRNCTLDSSGLDNLYTEGDYNLFDNNIFTNPGQVANGDNIQLAQSVHSPSIHCTISNNMMDTTGTPKQCVIIGGNYHRISNNYCLAGLGGINVAIGIGNVITGNTIVATSTTNRTISNEAINTVINANVIIDTNGLASADGSIFNASSSLALITNNTVIGKADTRAIVLETTSTNAEVYNNILVNSLNGIAHSTGGIVEEHNIFYNNTQDILQTPATPITPDTTDILADPLLDSDHKPDPSSPCYHAGKAISFSAKDFRGHKFNIPPTIGAYEFTSGSVAKSGRNIR